MPTIQTAKKVAENALSTIGAFPASMSAPDEGELKKTLIWLEMVISNQVGIRPVAGFWEVMDIPLEAGIGDYDLQDYVGKEGVQDVFSVFLVDAIGDTDPLDIIYESTSIGENLKDTGSPQRVAVTKNREMKLRVFPTPTQVEQDQGLVLRVRFQCYNETIDPNAIKDIDLRIRPSWYLWLTKRVSYEIGCGPVRRLAEGELKRLKDDAKELENALLARDGKYTTSNPPVTEPMEGSLHSDYDCSNSSYRPGYNKNYSGRS